MNSQGLPVDVFLCLSRSCLLSSGLESELCMAVCGVVDLQEMDPSFWQISAETPTYLKYATSNVVLLPVLPTLAVVSYSMAWYDF